MAYFGSLGRHGQYGAGTSKAKPSRYAIEAPPTFQALAGTSTSRGSGKPREYGDWSLRSTATLMPRTTTAIGDLGVTKSVSGQKHGKAAKSGVCQRFDEEFKTCAPQRPPRPQCAKKQGKSKGKEEDEEFDLYQPTWCICMNPRRDGGGMIMCSNIICPYEWWHCECVPRGSKKWPGAWYCPECRESKDEPRKKLPDEVLFEKLRKYNEEYYDKVADLRARGFPLSG